MKGFSIFLTTTHNINSFFAFLRINNFPFPKEHIPLILAISTVLYSKIFNFVNYKINTVNYTPIFLSQFLRIVLATYYNKQR